MEYTYRVCLSTAIEIDVDAESEDEAIDKAISEVESMNINDIQFDVDDINCLDEDKYSYEDFRDY